MRISSSQGKAAFRRGRIFAIAFFIFTTSLLVIYLTSISDITILKEYSYAIITAIGIRPDPHSGKLLLIMSAGSGLLIGFSTLLFRSLFPDDK
jgi:hypothetical protein